MSKQAEVLIKGKQQTEGTLHSLRRQVDALGELVTSTSVDSSSPSLSHLESSLVEDSQLGQSQVRGKLLKSLELLRLLENFGLGIQDLGSKWHSQLPWQKPCLPSLGKLTWSIGSERR